MRRTSRCRRASAGVGTRAALSLALVAGCGDSDERAPPLGSPRPIDGCEGFSYRPCDILTEPCQGEVFALMACLYGDDDREAPPVRRLDEDGALSLLLSDPETTGMMPALGMADAASDARAFALEVRALELLGMVAPGLIEDVSDVLEVRLSGAAAYYLPSTREVVVIDRGEPVRSDEANALLAHEFVHALQDRRHDLAAIEAAPDPDFDLALATSSLIEGEATFYQYLVLFAYAGVDLARVDFGKLFDELESLGTELTREAGSPAVTASGIFPYSYGPRYSGQRWLDGGNRAVDPLYESPPRTTLEVLRGAHGAALDSVRFEQAPAPLEGYELVSDDSAGAWISAATLANMPLSMDLPELAGHWKGDRYWVYATPDEEPAVAALWAIDWDSALAAEQFAAAAADLAGEGVQLHVEATGASTRLTAVERAGDLDAWRAQLAQTAAP